MAVAVGSGSGQFVTLETYASHETFNWDITFAESLVGSEILSRSGWGFTITESLAKSETVATVSSTKGNKTLI